VGSSGRELGLVILFFLFVFVFFFSLFFVFWILMLFSHCRKINNEPETKNLKNQKTKKNKIAYPKGGVVAESWILSFCFFMVVWFFVFLFRIFCVFLVWFYLIIA
jgi:hypothetical protein